MALAGLNHKLGYRGTTNTLLNFGEGHFTVRGEAGAIGYLVGEPGEGLRCMFHMMNEARIGVGLGAAMLGYAGYEASLDYARNRPQGRPIGPGGKDADAAAGAASSSTPTSSACCWRRRRYCRRRAGAGAVLRAAGRRAAHRRRRAAAREAGLLLEVLTPIAKSWPSEWCLEANSLAIQVHGGYGYTRDFPVEQYWRDNRLNMIHEGTHGIQALDLLGRKVVMDGGAGLKLLARAHRRPSMQRAGAVRRTGRACQRAGRRRCSALGAGHRGGLGHRRARGGAGQRHALPAGLRPHRAGVDVAGRGAVRAGGQRRPDDPPHGKLAACATSSAYELPKVDAWLPAVGVATTTCRDMQDAWF